jgi:Winged helix-turn helix
VRWRRIDLKRVIAERFGVDFHERYVGTLLKKLGFSHISARPRHPAQDERIVEAFKKNFPRALKAHLEGHLRDDADRNLVPDAMGADTGGASCSTRQASALESGSLPSCYLTTES